MFCLGRGGGVLDFSKELYFRRFLSYQLKFQLNIGQVLFAASRAKLGMSLNPIRLPSLISLFPEKSEELKPT